MKCSFCKSEMKDGTGTIYVRKDNTILNFCSSKCEKNMLKLGRKSANLKWARGN